MKTVKLLENERNWPRGAQRAHAPVAPPFGSDNGLDLRQAHGDTMACNVDSSTDCCFAKNKNSDK